jgi:hypothetical protein
MDAEFDKLSKRARAALQRIIDGNKKSETEGPEAEADALSALLKAAEDCLPSSNGRRGLQLADSSLIGNGQGREGSHSLEIVTGGLDEQFDEV